MYLKRTFTYGFALHPKHKPYSEDVTWSLRKITDYTGLNSTIFILSQSDALVHRKKYR